MVSNKIPSFQSSLSVLKKDDVIGSSITSELSGLNKELKADTLSQVQTIAVCRHYEFNLGTGKILVDKLAKNVGSRYLKDDN